MNYYDALVHHHYRLEEAERQQKMAQHLRDSQRKQEQTEKDTPKRASVILHLIENVKTALEALILVGPKRASPAGPAVAIKDASC